MDVEEVIVIDNNAINDGHGWQRRGHYIIITTTTH